VHAVVAVVVVGLIVVVVVVGLIVVVVHPPQVCLQVVSAILRTVAHAAPKGMERIGGTCGVSLLLLVM
jgi:hypothetical protein